MPNYYFAKIMEPIAFEVLCRDLLEALEGVRVLNFPEGKDGGIDLYYRKNGMTVAVQVKRSQDYESLCKVIKFEPDKLRKLKQKPSRYLLMTAASLGLEQKGKIKGKFDSYINDIYDIFGREDLNRLLGKFKTVEEDHIELWLHSTAILKKILHKRYTRWTQFQKNEIKKTISVFVRNPSFDSALEILQKKHFVIISGIPGIGKTAMAQMLVNYLLAKTKGGYDQFFSVKESNDVADLIEEDKAQIFFWDDFLGSEELDKQRLKYGGLDELIRNIRSSNNKLLILTTREYILQDALQFSGKLVNEHVWTAKCVIDLNVYTRDIRAKILYNHLVNAKLPVAYIRTMLNDRQYLNLINHKNFNPHIVDDVIKSASWKELRPEDFVQTFIDSFEKPSSVWGIVFKKSSREERYALWVLLTMGQPVLISDWKRAFSDFCKAATELKLSVESTEWEQWLNSLLGTFIKTRCLDNGNDEVVEFQDHSVFDFLISQALADNDLYESLINGSSYVEQLYTVFSDGSDKRKLVIPENLYGLLNEKILQIISNYKSCGTLSLDNRKLFIRKHSKLEGLWKCLCSFRKVNASFHFAENTVTPRLIQTDKECPYIVKCNLLSTLDWFNVNFNIVNVLDVMLNQIVYVSDCARYISLCCFFRKSYRFDNADFADKFFIILKRELDLCSDYSAAEHLLSDLELIHRIIPFLVSEEDLKNAESKFQEKKKKIENLLDNNGEWDDYVNSMKELNESIVDMFGNLKK